MSHRTPPKSKTTARQALVIFLLRGRNGWGRLSLVGGQRDPAALPQALLVELALLLTRRPIALELRDGILGIRLVPLLLGRPTGGEQAKNHAAQEKGSHHARHDTTRAARPARWLLLIAEQPPRAALAPDDLELALPGEEHHGRAQQTQPAGDLAGGVDPRMLTDHAHLVDPDRRLDRVVESVRGQELLANPRLREGPRAVLLRDQREHARGVPRLEALNRLGEPGLDLAHHAGRRGRAR